MQNPEPSVDFDTVANKKQQHEVNVGKILFPVLCIISWIQWILHHPLLTSAYDKMQPFQTHLDSVDTILSLHFLHSSLKQVSSFLLIIARAILPMRRLPNYSLRLFSPSPSDCLVTPFYQLKSRLWYLSCSVIIIFVFISYIVEDIFVYRIYISLWFVLVSVQLKMFSFTLHW